MRWHSHPLGLAKLNFDMSLINSLTAGGFIVRDWIGRLLKAGTAYYNNTSILVAEPRALCGGLNLAIEARFDHLIVEGDNKIVIQALAEKIHIPRQIHNIIKDIHARRDSIKTYKFQKDKHDSKQKGKHDSKLSG